MVAALAAPMTTEAATTESLQGAWRLVVLESSFNPGPSPERGIATFEAIDNGVRVVNETVDSAGQEMRVEYEARFDGNDYPVSITLGDEADSNLSDTVSIRQIDDYNFEVVNKMNGEVLNTAHWSISQDGRMQTSQITGKDAAGQTINNVLVFEKQ